MDDEFVGCYNPWSQVTTWWSRKKRVATERDLEKAKGALELISNTYDMRIAALEKEKEACNAEIRKYLDAGNKARAMGALKRRKRKEALLANLEKSMASVDGQRDQLEAIHMAQTIVEATRTYVQSTQGVISDKTQKHLDQTLDSLTDAQLRMDEVDSGIQSITQAGGEMSIEDEAGLEKELQAMMAESSAPQILTMPSPPRQPLVSDNNNRSNALMDEISILN